MFKKENSLPLWFILPIIFAMVTAIMASVADGVARSFQQFKPLQAYRLDILGSILGVVVFSVCSFLYAPPIVWGFIICVLFGILLIHKWNGVTIFQVVALIFIISLLGKESFTPGFFWSPYYKINLTHKNERITVAVNGIPQQTIQSIESRKKKEPFYFMPYQHITQNTPLENVLIIGAGTGSDVAIALKANAKHIDAVEIDPLLYQLGKRLNPNQPYSDPRVRLFIDDGRAFLQKTKNSYDLIIFALPDSLTLISGQSSLRLENYLFTREAIVEMSKHLKPTGVFAMYNYYRESWLVDRFAYTLMSVFSHPPCLDAYGSKDHWLSVLTISPHSASLQCGTLWAPLNKHYLITSSSDDHPFIYLKENRIPFLYIVTLALIFFVSLNAVKIGGGSFYAMKNYLDFFFMGAAFLLLETKNIINFALLFGTTWFVNALVFLGILLTIYLAIEVTHRIKLPKQPILYGLLLISLAISWIVPGSYLLSLAIPLRFLTATVLAFAPIFMANLIFSERFRNMENSTDAFGANLIGAMVGGLLEYSSLIIGYHHLLFLVAALYICSFLCMTTALEREVN
jgi:SAM-dependent methyltransferase